MSQLMGGLGGGMGGGMGDFGDEDDEDADADLGDLDPPDLPPLQGGNQAPPTFDSGSTLNTKDMEEVD